MKRLIALFIMALAGIMLAVSPAFADSPHFIYADNSINSAGALKVSFKDAGLGTGSTAIVITVRVTTATAVYQCFNNGGNHPKAGNKETVSSGLATSGTFPVSHGQTTGSLTVGPPSQGSFSCPSGQSLYLQSVRYSGTYVSDATGNSAESEPDPIGPVTLHILVS